MRKYTIFALTFIMGVLICASCNGGAADKGTDKDSIVFDSVKVDSVLALGEDTAGPRCHVSLCLTYFKGKNAGRINDSIIRSGILSPDYFSITPQKITPQEAADSFVTRYVTEYERDYGELYKADKMHGASYNCEYILKTHVIQENDKYYTYIANIYNYGGGAHGSSIVVARNIDIKTGKIVSLKDMFVPGYEHELNELIVKALCEKYEVADLKALNDKTIFLGIDVYAPDNFIIEDDGITFIYSSDEIASHAEGEIRAEVGNKDLERILRK